MGSKLVLAAASVALGFFAVVTSPALSAPGGNGGKPGSGTGSIRLNQTDPHLGDWVTFTTSGGARIALACYQGGLTGMVYSADQAVGTAFLLGGTSSLWLTNGGPAVCTAWLYQRSLSRGYLASINFNAGGAR